MKNSKHQKIRRHLQSPMQRQAYAHTIRYISMLTAAVMLVVLPQTEKMFGLNHVTDTTTAISDIKEDQESENITTALTTPTTNVVQVTTVTTTTTITTTTTVATTEEPTEPPSEEAVEEEIVEEYYEEDTCEEEYYEEEYYEEDDYSDYTYSEGSYYAGTYTAKWYPGSVGSWGFSGRDLISGYSVASPDFPQGTILYITGGGLDGEYRVDDTGCPSGVIDFFYYYGEVPSPFDSIGACPIEVTVIGYY